MGQALTLTQRSRPFPLVLLSSSGVWDSFLGHPSRGEERAECGGAMQEGRLVKDL